MTHICVSILTIIGSDNGLSPGRCQAIIWTNDGILLIWTLATNLSEILSEIHAYSFKKMHLKMASAKWRPFCLGLNVLRSRPWPFHTETESRDKEESTGCKPTDLYSTLPWRHNGRDSVSNHQPRHCLLNGLFRRRSKKTSKLRVTGLCAGNSPVTGEFPAQMASNAENVSIWWRHHDSNQFLNDGKWHVQFV